MYKVRIRGEKDLIDIRDDEQGAKIADDWKRGNLKGNKVEIAGGWFEGDDIRAVFPVSEGKKFEQKYFSEQELRELDTELEPYKMKIGTGEYHKYVQKIAEELSAETPLAWSPFTNWYIEEAIKKLGSVAGCDTLREAERIVQERFVGNVIDWDRWLVDNSAVVFLDGQMSLLTYPGGHMPYVELADKKEAYENWKTKNEIATFEKLKQINESYEK